MYSDFPNQFLSEIVPSRNQSFNPSDIMFTPDPSYRLCELSIAWDARNVSYVSFSNPNLSYQECHKLVLEAVKLDFSSFIFYKEQDTEICEAAVNINPKVMMFFKDREEILNQARDEGRTQFVNQLEDFMDKFAQGKLKSKDYFD